MKEPQFVFYKSGAWDDNMDYSLISDKYRASTGDGFNNLGFRVSRLVSPLVCLGSLLEGDENGSTRVG